MSTSKIANNSSARMRNHARPKPNGKGASSRSANPSSDRNKVLAAGKYFRDPAGKLHFVAKRENVPVAINSDAFRTIVADLTGKSRKDRHFPALLADVEDAARASAKTGRVESCSAYDRERHRLLLNLGAGNVLEVRGNGSGLVPNGTGGVLFVDEPDFVPLEISELRRWAKKPIDALALMRKDIVDCPPLAEGGLTLLEVQALCVVYWVGALIRILARSNERPRLVTRFGMWEQAARTVAECYGFTKELDSALRKMSRERIAVAVGAEPILAFLAVVARQHPDRTWTAASLHAALAAQAGTGFMPPAATPSARELSDLLQRIEQDGAAVVRVERSGKAHGNVVRWTLHPISEGEDQPSKPLRTPRRPKTDGRGGVGGAGGAKRDLFSDQKRNKKGRKALARHPPRTPALAVRSKPQGKAAPR